MKRFEVVEYKTSRMSFLGDLETTMSIIAASKGLKFLGGSKGIGSVLGGGKGIGKILGGGKGFGKDFSALKNMNSLFGGKGGKFSGLGGALKGIDMKSLNRVFKAGVGGVIGIAVVDTLLKLGRNVTGQNNSSRATPS